MYKNDLEDHLSVCKFSPVSCEWCGEKIAFQDKEVRASALEVPQMHGEYLKVLPSSKYAVDLHA